MPEERQLRLFASRFQRGVQLPPPKEQELHIQLADILKAWIMPRWRYSHLPLGEYRDKATAAKLKAMGVVAGLPDFMFVGPGTVFFLELKRPGSGRLSDAQLIWMRHIMASGFGYLATTDLKDAVEELKAMGIVRDGVHVQ